MVELSPYQALSNIWKKIPYHTKLTFASALILGFFVHMFAMANLIPNHDTVILTWDKFHWVIVTGRWFAWFPQWLTGIHNLSWLSSFMAIIYLAVAACLMGACLKIKKTINCILLSFLLVSFPSVTMYFTYAGWPDIGFFAVPLACLAAYITSKYKYGFCFGWIFVTLTIAIYQAYISIAAGLLIAVLIVDALRGDSDALSIFIKGIKSVAVLVVGFIAYTVILNIVLNTMSLQLSPYMGIDNFGGFALYQLPERILHAYVSVFNFFYRDSFNLHHDYMRVISFDIVFIVMALAVIILITSIILINKLYKSKALLAVLAFLIIVFPLGVGSILIISSHFHMLMVYSFVIILISVPALLEICVEMLTLVNKKHIRQGLNATCGVMLIALTLYCINYTILANKTYLKLEVANRHSIVYSTILFAQIQNQDFFDPNLTIVISGAAGSRSSIQTLHGVRGVEGASPFLGPGMFSYASYLRNFMGIDQNIRAVGSDSNFLSESDLAILENMPVYPLPGSIKYSNGEIFVKFSELR